MALVDTCAVRCACTGGQACMGEGSLTWVLGPAAGDCLRRGGCLALRSACRVPLGCGSAVVVCSEGRAWLLAGALPVTRLVSKDGSCIHSQASLHHVMSHSEYTGETVRYSDLLCSLCTTSP